MSKKGVEIINLLKKSKNYKHTPEIKSAKNNKDKNSNDPIVDLLKILLNIQSKKHKVSQNLVSNVSDLNRIINEKNPDVPALNGWRYEIFGKYALDIKNGKTTINVKNGKIKFSRD